MDGYSNSRWRESEYSPTEMPTSSRDSPIYHSPVGDPRLTDHKSRVWNRNGSISSPHSHWDISPLRWSPQSPHRSPLLSTPDNDYMFANRKDDIPYHSGHLWREPRSNRRPDDYRRGYHSPPSHKRPILPRGHQREFFSHPYLDRGLPPPPPQHLPHLKEKLHPPSSPSYSDNCDAMYPDIYRYHSKPFHHPYPPHRYHHHSGPPMFDASPRDPRSRHRTFNSSPSDGKFRYNADSKTALHKKHMNYDKTNHSSKEVVQSNDHSKRLSTSTNGSIERMSESNTNSQQEITHDKTSRHCSEKEHAQEIVLNNKKKKKTERNSAVSSNDIVESDKSQPELEDTFEIIKSVLLNRILLEHSYCKTSHETEATNSNTSVLNHHSLSLINEPSTTISLSDHMPTISEKKSDEALMDTLFSSEMLADYNDDMELDDPAVENDDDLLSDNRSSSSSKSLSLKGFLLDLDDEPSTSPSCGSSDEQEHLSLIVSIPIHLSNNTTSNCQHSKDLQLSNAPDDVDKVPLNNYNCDVTKVKDENTPPSAHTQTNNYTLEYQQCVPKSQSAMELPISKKTKLPKPFIDFVPEVLETRSRAETATMRRRQKMAKQMERNELERKRTAVTNDQDYDSMSSPSRDDTSSIISSSSIKDSSSIALDTEFTPEFVQYCKSRYAVRSLGSGDSILHKVCRTGKTKVAKYYIVVEHVKVDCQDNAGWTPLHEACNNGFTDIAKLLLENGADPNIASFDGTRPIHDAIEAGNMEIVKLLVEHGADVMAEYSEKTPFELATYLEQNEIAYYLKELINERKKNLAIKKESGVVDTHKPKLEQTASILSKFEQCVKLPFDGYSKPMFGEELDSPLIYISAIIEESKLDLLPVYNIQVSTGTNPRKHNFHLLNDVVHHLQISREELLLQINISTYHITITDFMHQLQTNPLTSHSAILSLLKEQDTTKCIELVPLCNSLRKLLDIEVYNIDD